MFYVIINDEGDKADPLIIPFSKKRDAEKWIKERLGALEAGIYVRLSKWDPRSLALTPLVQYRRINEKQVVKEDRFK